MTQSDAPNEPFLIHIGVPKEEPVAPNEGREETNCPTCGGPCKIEWSGLDLVANTGDETLASKNYTYIDKNLYEANKSLRDANKNLNSLLNDAEQRGEYKARHDLRNEIKSLRDQLSKEREFNDKLKQGLENGSERWKKHLELENKVLKDQLEKERELTKVLTQEVADLRVSNSLLIDNENKERETVERLKKACDAIQASRNEMDELWKKEREMRKELVEMGEDLFKRCVNSGYLSPGTYFKYKNTLSKASELDKT